MEAETTNKRKDLVMSKRLMLSAILATTLMTGSIFYSENSHENAEIVTAESIKNS